MPEYILDRGDAESCAWFQSLDAFTRAYVECAMWIGLGEDEAIEAYGSIDGASLDDLAPETRKRLCDDASDFLAYVAREGENMRAAVDDNATQAGHDFWLTRNGHGAGFWDRGDLYGSESMGDKLTAAAESFSSCDMYVGDDGKIYLV